MSSTNNSGGVLDHNAPEQIDYEKLCEILTAASESNLDEETQEQIGQLAALLPYIKDTQDKNLDRAGLAAKFLLSNESKNVAAGIIIDKITPFKRTPALRVVFGLGVFVYIAAAIVIIITTLPIDIPLSVSGIDVRTMMIVAFFGGLGSVVSMMSRIGSFAEFADDDPFLPMFAGLFRPIIGISFALFIYSAIEADIISINLKDDKKIYFIIALSFVSGFSERLAKDVISRIEGTYGRQTKKTNTLKGRERPKT